MIALRIHYEHAGNDAWTMRALRVENESNMMALRERYEHATSWERVDDEGATSGK